MIVLQRYFYREILTLSFLISFSLVVVLALYRGGEILQELAGEGIELIGFLTLVVTSIPELMELLLPVGFFVGTLSVLQRSRVGKELMISLLSGITPFLLLRPFLLMGVLVGLLTLLLSFYVAPLGREYSDETLRVMLSERWSSLVKPGRFVTFMKDMTVYAHSRDDEGQLKGVVLDDFRDGEGHVVVADRADLGQQGDNLLVGLKGVTIMQEEKRVYLESLQIPLKVDTWSYVGSGDPTRLQMGEIYEKLQEEGVDAEDRVLWEIEWHRRMSRFPMVLSLAFLAGSFMVLSRQERTPSRRPLVVVSLLALVFELTNLGLQKSALDEPVHAWFWLSFLYPLYIVPSVVCGACIFWRSRFRDFEV